MKAYDVVEVTSLVFIIVWIIVATSLSIGYLKSKALGLQTFLDKVMISLQFGFGLTVTTMQVCTIITIFGYLLPSKVVTKGPS